MISRSAGRTPRPRAKPDSVFDRSDSTAIVRVPGAGVARGIVRDASGSPLANVRVGVLDGIVVA
jgi:hypothetical protein